MGMDITNCQFDEATFSAFQNKLGKNLQALEQMLQTPGFGVAKSDSVILGAELEMYIIDKQGLPLYINQEILNSAKDPQLTLELNRYNLEHNLNPYSIAQQPFSSTENEITEKLKTINKVAEKYQGRILPIGILPTLTPENFGTDAVTDKQRYHLLLEQLLKRRGNNFSININGRDPLQFDMQDITLEGANTSFQVHYRVEPQKYADTFNAIQLVTPLVLATAANSPGLFGHSLWQETRIPLFKQAIDCRVRDHYQWHEPARVNFGQGWVRKSALELFRETVNIYSPLLPVCSHDDPLEQLQQEQIPGLPELRLHQSTVWLWNRPVYDDADGGHLRIEMRSLPAGPTAIDMVANAAFYIGLAEYYRDKMETIMPALPFGLAEFNFYRAAQSGLSAKIIWPKPNQSGCSQQPLIDVLKQNIESAKEGLLSIGISSEEVEKYLGVIRKRVEKGMTGADWQLSKIEQYAANHSKEESHRLMLEDYIQNSLSNLPLSEWE